MNQRLQELGNGGTTTAVYRLAVAVILVALGIIQTMVWRGVDAAQTVMTTNTSLISAIRVEQSRAQTERESMARIVDERTKDRFTGEQAREMKEEFRSADRRHEAMLADHEQRLRSGGL